MDKEEEEDIKELFESIMEGYSDKVIPLLSDLITENYNNKNINGENASADQTAETCFSRKNKGSTKRVLQAEVSHQPLVPMEITQKGRRKKRDRNSTGQCVSLEKERRNKLNEKTCVLQYLVPNLPNQMPRAEIIEETVKYIKNLEAELKEFEESKKKKELSKPSKFSLNSSNCSIVNVTVSGDAVFFGIQVEINNVEEPFLFSKVIKVFENYKTEILTATITTSEELKMKKIITMSLSVLINETGGGSMEEIKKAINRLFVPS